MKRWLKWIVIVLVIAVLLGTTLRVLAGRKAKKVALEAQQAAQKIQAVVELAPSDLVQAKTVELSQVMAISGPLKAVNSAIVKAKVAGELQGLKVREGDFVKAGDVIAHVDSTEYQARVRQAQQQAESSKAQVDIAKRNFENNQSLVAQGFISKTALDSSISTLASTEANYRAAQAGADVALKSLNDTVVRAPIAGQIAQRLAQAGERVAIDGRIVEIVDLSRLELEASLSATDSLGVRVGQTAQLTVEGSDKPLSAKVVRVNPSAVAGSRAILAYLALESTHALRQGLFAQGSLAVGKVTALTVPVSSVRTDKPQPYVQWVNKDQVEHQTVELGAQGDFNGVRMVEVKGIADGANVLSGTVGTLRAGTLVKITQGAK